MTSEQAIDWLRQVNGHLYRNKQHASGKRAWVAVVRTPRSGARNGKLIVALGATMEEATAAAEGQWQRIWQELSQAH